MMVEATKQQSFGSNSGNYYAEGNINKYAKERITSSVISDVISSLLEKEVYTYFGDEKTRFAAYEGAKIEYNEIKIYGKKFIEIASPDALESLKDVINSYDNENKINSLIRKVSSEYDNIVVKLDAYTSIKKITKDLVLIKVHEKLLETIKGSDIIELYEEELLCETIDLIIFHVFRLCKILDVPPKKYIEEYKTNKGLIE